MKKINQVRQVLNTCSPLEKIVKINGALGTGVNTISKKLCSECKNKAGPGKKQDPSATKTTERSCAPCHIHTPKDSKVETPTSSVPGCMPFSDDVPVKPVYPKDVEYHKRKCVNMEKRDKACSPTRIGKPIPPED